MFILFLIASGASLPAHALDLAFMKELKVFDRPQEENWESIGPDHPISIAMGTDHLSLRKLKFIFPDKFSVLGKEKAAALADQAFLKILRSQTGLVSMCRFAGGTRADVEAFLGVSASVAKSLMRTCAISPIPNHYKYRLGLAKDRMKAIDPGTRLNKKRYVFLISRGSKTPEIEAYTTRENISYVVLLPGISDESYLIRAVAHELAISYDLFSKLGAVSSDLLGETTSVSNKQQEEGKLSCALRDPALRYAASTQRAFVFEDRIIKELGLSMSSPPVARQGSCREILARNSLRFRAMAPMIAPESRWYGRSCGTLSSEPRERLRQYRHNLDLLVNTKAWVDTDKVPAGFCEVFLEPQLGPAIPDQFPGGPRPRMGGWEPQARSGTEEISSLINDEPISDEGSAALGTLLLFPENELTNEGKAGTSK